MTDMSMARWLA